MNVGRPGPLRAVLLSVFAAASVAHVAGVDEPLDAEEAPAPSIRAVEASPAHERFDASIVRRDPFDGAPATPHAGPRSPLDTTRDVDRASTTFDVPAIAPLPGDAGVPASANAGSLRPTVHATIVGPHPVAYVSGSDGLQIVRVGDAVSDRLVVAIDMRGIAFRDGTRLDLPDTHVATPAPLATPRRVDDEIRAEIKRMRALLKTHAAPHPSVPAAAPPRADPLPTPQPLRTVDPGGAPVGVRPTPDAVDPTAYPVPIRYGIPSF